MGVMVPQEPKSAPGLPESTGTGNSAGQSSMLLSVALSSAKEPVSPVSLCTAVGQPALLPTASPCDVHCFPLGVLCQESAPTLHCRGTESRSCQF